MERRSPNIDRRRGFTLIESLIASVILAVAVVGIAGMLAAAYQNSKDQVSSAEATQLARQLMEEISARPFEVPPGSASDAIGWSGGNRNRSTYDDILDYHGYTDESTKITTLDGTTHAFGTAGPYTRSVSVTAGPVPPGHAPAQTTNENDDPIKKFKHVQVTVTRPTGASIVLSKLFTSANVAN